MSAPFGAIDANADGWLTRLELVSHAEAVGRRIEGGIQRLFERDDRDSNGFISWHEYSGPKDAELPMTASATAPTAGAFSHAADSARVSRWCRQLHSKRAVATLCREDLISVGAFGATVYDTPLNGASPSDDDPASRVDLYPGSFIVRRGAETAPKGCDASEAMTMLRAPEALAPPPSSAAQQQQCDVRFGHPVVTLRQHVRNVSSTMSDDAPLPTAFAAALADAVATSDHDDGERHSPAQAMAKASALFAASSRRSERNAMLRAVAEAFATPHRAATLVELFGCGDQATYDEFTQCRMSVGGWQMELNVYQRARQHANGRRATQWACRTCGLHNHARWFASAAIAGTVRYTMARPFCFGASLPTFKTLDADVADAGAEGTAIDAVGARYVLNRAEVGWETREIVELRAGQSLVFSPAWFHRVVPPHSHATHSPLTLMVRHAEADLKFTRANRRRERSTTAPARPDDRPDAEAYVLEPHAANVPYSDAHACWSSAELVRALREPRLDLERERQHGLRKLTCESDTDSR